MHLQIVIRTVKKFKEAERVERVGEKLGERQTGKVSREGAGL